MENRGRKVVAAAAAAGTLAISLAALLATRPAEAAPPDEKLDYLLRLTEGLDDILRELEQLAEGPPLEAVPLERLTALTRAQFLADPEGVCSLIGSQQPNLCRGAPLSVMVTLAPGATTTVTTTFPEGFIYVLTSLQGYTDVPFAVQAVLLRDDVVWYVDAGMVPIEYQYRSWQAAAYRSEIRLINTSALNVNLHLTVGGWELETKTFRNVMSVLALLAYTTAEHGTPEGKIE